jgi:DnaJ-class molecular chaperone
MSITVDAMDGIEELCSIHKIKTYHDECSRCHGEGEIEADDDIFTFRPHFERCYACGGRGQNPWKTCEFCDEEAMEKEREESGE